MVSLHITATYFEFGCGTKEIDSFERTSAQAVLAGRTGEEVCSRTARKVKYWPLLRCAHRHGSS